MQKLGDSWRNGSDSGSKASYTMHQVTSFVTFPKWEKSRAHDKAKWCKLKIPAGALFPAGVITDAKELPLTHLVHIG